VTKLIRSMSKHRPAVHPEQFADIIVKSDSRGRVTRIRDIGRVEVGVAGYGNLTRRIVRGTSIVLVIYGADRCCRP
jgi:multidrug efflux pump subunit AcrB